MIYIDNAATTRYKPRRAVCAAIKEIRLAANPGRSSHAASVRAAVVVEECRETVCSHFFDGNVIFTKNCTEALNLAIFGSDLSYQVVTDVYQHNSVLRPLKRLADDGKINLKLISPVGGDLAPALRAALTRRTSMVILSGMSNVTGHAPDIGRLAGIIKAQSDALVLVDMAQAAGHIRHDLKDVDMCAFAGHKSLHGLQGSGFLLAKKNVALRALILGGTGTSTLDLRHPNSLPEGMEAGTLNTVGVAALKEAIDFTFDNFDRINGRIRRLTEQLKDGLKDIPTVRIYAASNGIVLCNIEGTDSVGVADMLNGDYGICVRAGLHCAPLAHRDLGTLSSGAIRFGIGYNNTVGDIERCVEAMKEISHKIPSRGISY